MVIMVMDEDKDQTDRRPLVMPEDERVSPSPSPSQSQSHSVSGRVPERDADSHSTTDA
jgi:hypothetical protein